MLRLLSSITILWLSTIATAAPEAEFDHFTTGFVLDGAHARATCDACHAGGDFGNAPRQCSGCHSPAGLVRATSKPSHHITTTNRCESCHRSVAWTPVLRVDHLEVFGPCSSCHNDQRGQGKPPRHLPTANDCGACHRDVSWSFARMDHFGIADDCAACHNGTFANGKPFDHIPTTADCSNCHNVARWR